MKSNLTIAIAALLSSTSAIKTENQPDVFGKNGKNFINNDPRYDVSQIAINITGPSKEAKIVSCYPGMWVTFHAKGYIADGRVVTDTREENGGLPKVTAIGTSDVQKCLDLGIQQLKEGDKATLTCPSYLAYGSAFTQPPIGYGDPIPLNSEVKYDVEVLECALNPGFTSQTTQPVTSTLQPGRCFYLHLQESDDTANNLVMSTDASDYKYYWPGRYMFLEPKVVDDPAQQWFYNETTGTIHNAVDSGYLLQNDKGELMTAGLDNLTPFTSAFFPRDQRKWFYDPKEMTLGTEENNIRNIIGVFDSPKPMQYVSVGVENMMLQKSRHRWVVDYCNQVSLGTSQEYPQEISMDINAPLPFETINLEGNLRKRDMETVIYKQGKGGSEETEIMDINGSFV